MFLLVKLIKTYRLRILGNEKWQSDRRNPCRKVTYKPPSVDYAVKQKILPRQIVAGNGFATMRIIMYYFHTLETVVRVTIVVLHYVATIPQRDIPGTGKPARSAEMILRPKCMSTTAQTNTILKSWQNHQISNPLIVQNAKR